MKLPGKFFRTPSGQVGRPFVTKSGDAPRVAKARGVRRVYRIAWVMLVSGEVREVRGSAFWTETELLDIPRSRWTQRQPRKVPTP